MKNIGIIFAIIFCFLLTQRTYAFLGANGGLVGGRKKEVDYGAYQRSQVFIYLVF